MALAQPPEWLNQSYLESALRQGLNEPSFTIKECNIKPAVAAGENFGSLVFRADLQVVKNEHEEKLSIIIKMFSPALENTPGLRQFFYVEIKMLSEVLPQIQQLLDKKGTYPKLAPECLFVQTEPTPVLIMEDLSTNGYTSAKCTDGLDSEHMTIVLQSIARFHAASYVVIQQHPELKSVCKDSLFSETSMEVFLVFVHAGLKALNEVLPTWGNMTSNSIEKFKILEKNVVKRMIDVGLLQDGVFNVINHGDLWPNNMMFKYDPSGRVQGLKLIDFQISNYNSPGLDLNHFLFTAPRDELRLQNYDTHLEIYYKELAETLKALDTGLVYEFKTFKKEMNDRLFVSVITSFIVVPLTIARKEQTQDIHDAIEKGAVDGAVFYRNERIKSLIPQMLKFFEERGIL